MAAKDFPKAAFGAVAVNSITDGFGRGDDTEASGVIGRVFAEEPPKREKTALDSAALFADVAKIALAANVLLRAKTHGRLAPEEKLRLASGVCGPWHDVQRGPCGLQRWPYGREIRSCGLALSGVDEK